MRAVVSSRSERNRPDLPLLTVARERGVFVRRDDDENHNAIPDDLSNYKVARAGDLVVNKMKAWQGALGLAPVDGIVSPAYYVFDFDIADRAFGQYLLRSKPYVALMAAASDGVRIGQWDLVMQRFRELPVLVPPAEEQAAIVKYLGHAHARIDHAIAAKRKLIALLDEQNTAVAAALLTGSVPVEGEVPSDGSGWVPAGRLCTIVTGAENSGNAQPDGAFPFFVRGREVLRSDTYTFDAEAVMTPGDGQGGVGKVFHYYSGKFQAHQRVYVFKDFQGILPKYFYWHLKTFFHRFALSRSNTVTMESLRRPMLRSFRVPVPPLVEQTAIVQQVESELTRSGQTIDAARREIDLLREFRTRLTADVVTGQVDVRAVAATLPDPPADQVFDVGDDDEDESYEEELLAAADEGE